MSEVINAEAIREEYKPQANEAVQSFLRGAQNGSRVKDIHEREVDLSNESGQLIVVLGTGGTFQSEKGDNGIDSTVPLGKCFESLNLPEGPDSVVPIELFREDSSVFRAPHWRIIAESIVELLEGTRHRIDSFILVHGTDTLELGSKYLAFSMGRGLKRPIITLGTNYSAMSNIREPKDKMEDAIHAAIVARQQDVAETMLLSGSSIFPAVQARKVDATGADIFEPYDGKHYVQFSQNPNFSQWHYPSTALTVNRGIPFEPFTDIQGTDSDVIDLNTMGIGERVIENCMRGSRAAIVDLFGSSTFNPDRANAIIDFYTQGKLLLLKAPFLKANKAIGDYNKGKELKHIPHVNALLESLQAKLHILMSRYVHEATMDEKYGWVYPSEVQMKILQDMRSNLLGELVEKTEG